MNFLSWQSIAIAAAATIPPLVALYFLKLKRNIQSVPSTLLWKKSIEDLHVNSPFQRLRSSLLLLLQLLVLLLGAMALGKPMFESVQTHQSTIILLIDQSASMAVTESDGRTRLEHAKEQAKRFVDNMDEDARAMVIAFCDRATVAAPFDTDVSTLKKRIDEIEQTESATDLGEAMSLAEAYTQNIIVGLEDRTDIEMRGSAPPATVALFTDGRIQNADKVALQRFDIDRINVVRVGERGDNVGILAMDARRDYERPTLLEVAATVRNFGDEPVTCDAVLHIDGTVVDIKSVTVPTGNPETRAAPDAEGGPVDPTQTIVFDSIEFAGGGVVEVELKVNDALAVDDRAWSIIDEPRDVKVLLVTEGNFFLESALSSMSVLPTFMSPAEYENAPDERLIDDERSVFDVVIFDGHSTARLPQGNYFFWGAIPAIEGVQLGGTVRNQVIFNWNDTHAILRHVGVETLVVYEWQEIKLPSEAEVLIEGESTPVLAYLARDASQYLINAYQLIGRDAAGNQIFNTYWATSVDFLMFLQNALSYLSSNVVTAGSQGISPGTPLTLPVPGGVSEVEVIGPDNRRDGIPVAGYPSVHYADTRRTGVYRLEPGVPGRDRVAVNLFNVVESHVAPAEAVELGSDSVSVQASEVQVSQPAWPWFLIALLVFLILEWIVYNKRIFI